MSKKAIMKNQQVLCDDIKLMIEEARLSVAAAVNSGLTMLYWGIGNRINKEILQGHRAEYGAEIISALSKQLEIAYGRSFSEKNLRRMLQFAEVFSDKKIVVSLIRQLSWTHFIALIPIKNQLQREFYAEMCKIEKWSVRTLRKKIDSMLFERTAISHKPEKIIKQELKKLKQDEMISTDLVFRDPYFVAQKKPSFRGLTAEFRKLSSFFGWMKYIHVFHYVCEIING